MGWYFRGYVFKASVQFCLLHVLTIYVYGGVGCLPEHTEKYNWNQVFFWEHFATHVPLNFVFYSSILIVFILAAVLNCESFWATQ